MRKYVLDTNCYIAASRTPGAHAALRVFVARAAPALYLSSVVAAELRAGVRRGRRAVEDKILEPFIRRDRVLTPGPAAWDAVGRTLALLRDRDGVHLAQVSRSFAFDVLLAFSCREHGATLVSANERDMRRIRRAFAFEYVLPYPEVT